MLEKIEVLRVVRGLDQGELEVKAGLAQGRISKWKRGIGKGPSVQEGLRIARVLGVSLDYLADESEDDPLQDLARWLARVADLFAHKPPDVIIRNELGMLREKLQDFEALLGSRSGGGTGAATV